MSNVHQLVRPQKCGHCGTVINARTSVSHGNIQARPGDLSICFYCGHICKVDSNLDLAPISDEELEALDEDTKKQLKLGQELVRKHSKRLN